MKATTIDSSSVRRPRRRFTVEQIQEYLRAFDRSGVCVSVFAREQGLVYSVLLRWLRRRRQAAGDWPGDKRGARRRLQLQEVSLGTLMGGGRWAAEIVRPDGVTLRVAHDVPRAWLEGLLSGGPC